MTTPRRKAPAITDAEEARIQQEIAADPDSAEATDEELSAMRPAAEVLPPDLYAALISRPRGRPKATETKVAVKLRLDRGAVDAFKATGPGWQTRMNETLVKAAKRLT